MPIYQHYLYVVGGFHGILFALLLLSGSRVSVASRLLGIWCLFLAFRFLSHLISMDGDVNMFSFLLGWHLFLPASYGALMYLYCKYALTQGRFRWRDAWHFAPLIFCYLLNLDALMLTPELKANNEFLLHFTWRAAIAETILWLQAFVYWGLSVRLVWRSFQKASHTLAGYNPDIFRWLWKLLILYAIIWLLKFGGMYLEPSLPLFFAGDVMIFVFVYSIALAQWKDPDLFTIRELRRSEQTPEPGEINPQSEDIPQDQYNPEQYCGALDPELRTELMAHIQKHMEQHKTFLNSKLTLKSLSEAVDISPHHLSEVLNQQNGKNFYRFVNEYRIEHVCAALQETPDAKLIDLAIDAGFSSKSTFNAVFKQIKNQTPSEFRKSINSAS